ncbi:MAG: PEP-CTERM sorting domain-containing protein [Thiobacillus sp.]|nr:PEP-CTERM sorting domain-containing protein [Thiobacillus sp.]
MKLKLIALAAMLAAGSAQAKVADSNDNGNTGSGDMFASLVSVSNNASYTVDLGLRLDQFTAASALVNADGVKLVWDLDAGTFADLSAVSTGLGAQMQTLNYGSVYTTFATAAVAGASDLKFDVKAMDGLPASFATAGANRYLSTSAANSITATNGQVFVMDNVDVYPTAANIDATNSTHGTDFNIAGANMFDAGDATNVYFQNGSKDNWNGATSFTSTGSTGNELSFYALTNSSTTAASQATVVKYAGVWSFDVATAQLSYATAAAAVPEAETYAMMLAGLGLMATVARRRKAKQA